MDILLNELSVHGQYASASDFLPALRLVLECRSLINNSGHILRCNARFTAAKVTHHESVHELLRAVSDVNLKRTFLSWITKEGPFWDGAPEHSADDLYELKSTGQVVTESSLAEAAFKRSCVLSFAPSCQFNDDKLQIVRIDSDNAREEIEIDNQWERVRLEKYLAEREPPIRSWDELRAWALRSCSHLTFAEDVLDAMRGQPFVHAAAEQIQRCLGVLHEMKSCFNEDGSCTEQWHALYNNYFSRKTAWFTDSSDTEKNDPRFRKALTFKNPLAPGYTIFCPFHGKVRTSVLRIHFSWPITKSDPLFVVYIGPKLTKT